MKAPQIFKIRLKYQTKGHPIMDKEIELDINSFELIISPILNGEIGEESEVSEKRIEMTGSWIYDNGARTKTARNYISSEIQMKIPDQINSGINIYHLTIPTPLITRKME
jgi:hypothetical protein